MHATVTQRGKTKIFHLDDTEISVTSTWGGRHNVTIKTPEGQRRFVDVKVYEVSDPQPEATAATYALGYMLDELKEAKEITVRRPRSEKVKRLLAALHAHRKQG